LDNRTVADAMISVMRSSLIGRLPAGVIFGASPTKADADAIRRGGSA